ncbi:response regulator [Rhodobacteraceae bacterium RKSG542]|uniref:response regulator n=1 Tax=Pseudovibrio flavus TaxID=2529854 RepID=UPI0012BBBD71|nr:response regulator [Pseudovibrio flavus]MTI16736.1 response regulator [Pseudovibrio flavus]
MRNDPAILSGISVLIAEDNNYMRGLLRTMVTGFGVRSIYEAQDGADAIAVVLDRQPDIVLLDWVMSPVDGNEFLRILRSHNNPEIAKTPVIVISADSRRSVVTASINAGVNLFLGKPISPAVLFERMAAIISEGPNVALAKDRRNKATATDKWRTQISRLEKALSSGKISEKARKEIQALTKNSDDDQTFL